MPADALANRKIYLTVSNLGGTPVDTETYGVGGGTQGKPRIRKNEANNRAKLHLVPLVLALAVFPLPRRQDAFGTAKFPLENKNFIVSVMEFEILGSDATNAVLRPLWFQILHSERRLDLTQRFQKIAAGWAAINDIATTDQLLATRIEAHRILAQTGVNSVELSQAADAIILQQANAFGNTNALASFEALQLQKSLPPLLNGRKAKEGRLLSRIHTYRERNSALPAEAKRVFYSKFGALYCETCGFNFQDRYGQRGNGFIEAHHTTALSELLPDTETLITDFALVCANCHRIIHRKRPWSSVEDLKAQLVKSGNHFFA